MKISFIGLGIMGSRMASNLIDAGHDLIVWNRTRSRTENFLKKGASPAESPADAAKQAKVLITMLANPEAVRETADGSTGFLDSIPSGGLWIDCSTVHPSFSREMAAQAARRNIRYIDAPVAGTKGPAEKGELLILAGGRKEDLVEAEEIFRVIGRKTIHAGENGMGTSLKMVINLMLGHAMTAYSEALSLGQALGFRKEMLADVLLGGPTAAPFLNAKREKIESGQWEADFPLKHMRKDLHLALTSAFEQGIALPSTAAVEELFGLAEQNGLGDLDFSAVSKFLSP